ncbi:LAGLIDADG family homing endonuclease [Candidatus Kaiserbacteria bacterium]|nr:LAGLIDADG family homing endonuclease [Candidatus Kaiserbacteria bacterium]
MRANTVGKRCSEVERAYIAGFMDADGAIMACIERHPLKRYGFRVRVVVKITQHDREVLDWMRRKLAVGAVRANRPGTIAQTFDLLIRDQQHARAVLHITMPFLRAKRRQAKIAMLILDQKIESSKNLIQIARLADTLSKFNVRSKNRRKNFTAKIQEHISPND